MIGNEYSSEQRYRNKRGVIFFSVVSFLVLFVSYLTGTITLGSALNIAGLVIAVSSILYWLFASKNAEPIQDPSVDSSRATYWNLFLNVWKR